MNMMSQPFTPALKAHLDAQFSLFTDMTQGMFQVAQKINELNLQTACAVVEESVSTTKDVLSADDSFEAMAIAAAHAQPNVAHVRGYQQHLNKIAASAQVDFSKAAEQHIPEATRTAAALADEVARKATEETEKATQRQKAAMEKMRQPFSLSEEGDQIRLNEPQQSGARKTARATTAE